MTSFVTGATGFIGSALVEYLVRNLEMTKVLWRRGSNIKLIDELAVEAVEGDLSDVETLKKSIGNAEVVYNIAAETRESRPYEKYRAVNVLGFRNLLEASLLAGVKRVVQVSAIDVYGFNLPNTPVDENFHPRPRHPYHRSKLEAETLALQYMKDHPELGLTIIRPAIGFGPRDHRFTGRMLEGIRAGKITLPSGGNNRVSLIYAKDVAKALFLAAHSPMSSGKAYVVKGFDCTPRELVEELASHMGHPAMISSVPLALAYFMAATSEIFAKFTKSEPRVTRFRTEYVGRTRLLSDHKIRQDLGYEPEYDLVKGCKETVEWFKERVWGG